MTQDIPLANSGGNETAILPERCREIQAAYAENCRTGRAPYAGVSIHTIGELHWIMDARNWAGIAHARGSERADFRQVQMRNANLNDAALFEANLQAAQCEGVQMCRASLHWANLQGIQLQNADLRQANLFGANLRGANLRQAALGGANFAGTDVSDADFEGADLQDASFRQAQLTGANFTNVRLQGVDFFGAQGAPVAALLSSKG